MHCASVRGANQLALTAETGVQPYVEVTVGKVSDGTPVNHSKL